MDDRMSKDQEKMLMKALFDINDYSRTLIVYIVWWKCWNACNLAIIKCFMKCRLEEKNVW